MNEHEIHMKKEIEKLRKPMCAPREATKKWQNEVVMIKACKRL